MVLPIRAKGVALVTCTTGSPVEKSPEEQIAVPSYLLRINVR
jgi:hypothetical protein